MLKIPRRICVLLGLVLLALSPAAFAQLSTATMFGTVTDPTGAVIPKATVSIAQTDTGFVRKVVTGDDGAYRADFLPIGPYRVTIEASGFKKLDRSGITLTVSEDAHLDFALTLGNNEQT